MGKNGFVGMKYLDLYLDRLENCIRFPRIEPLGKIHKQALQDLHRIHLWRCWRRARRF